MEGPRLIVTDPGPGNGPAVSRELQQLWFAVQQRPWSSLTVIAVEPGKSARFIAEGLAEIGTAHRGVEVKVINAEGVSLTASSRLAVTLSTHVASGGLAIAVLDSLLQNQAGIPLALAADATLLAVHLGSVTSSEVRRTLELVGKDRVLGAVTVRER